MGRAFWTAAISLLVLLALANLALIGVMSGVMSRGGKADGHGKLHLHAPEHEAGASPFLSTPAEVSRAMLRLAEVKKDEVVADLGCGDARILVLAAKEFGARGLGVELDPEVFALARQNVRGESLEERITLVRGDMFLADIRSADVVALYLLPEALARLRPVLERQLRPGTRVVTHDFAIAGWKADREEKLGRGDGTAHTIHLYRR